jgi:amidase
VVKCARFLAEAGLQVEERRPPGVEHAYDLELALLGESGAAAVDDYLQMVGSTSVHPLHIAFIDRLRAHRATPGHFARRWAQWDEYRSQLRAFFREYDVILCPVYSHVALEHGHSALEPNFRGFSYTMAWNLAGAPAATVRCDQTLGLPVNVQVVARPWDDMTALAVCTAIENEFGGWKPA